MPMVKIGRRAEAQSLPWSVVQVFGDVVALSLYELLLGSTTRMAMSERSADVLVHAHPELSQPSDGR